jgi:hypothetical protein
MMRDKRGVPLVLGERTGTKGGHASVKSPTETNDERQKGGVLWSRVNEPGLKGGTPAPENI